MADTIEAVAVDPYPPPPPQPQQLPQQPPQQPPPPPPDGVDTAPVKTAIPVQDPPPAKGCFANKSGLEKCLIVLVVIILVIALAMIVAFLIYYFFASPPEGICLTDGCVKSASRIKDTMDSSQDPCGDFYVYSCKGWSKKQVLGPDLKKVDMETQLNKDHLMKLRELLNVKVESDDPEFTQKPRLFYTSCLDISKLNELDKKPFLALVQRVGLFPTLDANWNNTMKDFNFKDTVKELARMSMMPLFQITVDRAMQSSDRNRLYLSDGQLGLGKKEYYITEGHSQKLSDYAQWMTNTLVLLGADADEAEEDMEKVVDFEVKLAKLMRDDAEKASFTSNYKTLDVDTLEVKYPWMQWLELIQGIASTADSGIGLYIGKDELVINKEPAYFGKLGALINGTSKSGIGLYIGKDELVINKEPAYFVKLATLINGTSKRVLANYLMSRLLPLTAHLGSDFISETDTYFKKSQGKKDTDRWEYCAILTSEVYDEAVSRMYVEKYFNKESKEYVTKIVNDILTVFKEQLPNNKWMEPKTKNTALQKLGNLDTKIGYPDFLYDDEALTKLYKDVSAKKGEYLENTVSLLRFEASENMKKLRKSADNSEWKTRPTSLEARYDQQRNELVLPAAFLQKPIFNLEYSSAMNYAGVGSILGSKLIHGFDKQGKRYDANGNKQSWWTQKDENRFKSLSSCFVHQWGCYKWDGLSMNGNETLDENIAYNAGLKLGYKAYRTMIERRGTEEQRLPGLKMDNNKIFFISYAQIWCAKYTEEAKKNYLKTSGAHPPFPYRVFGTVQNSEAFSRAFECPIGTRMHPREKCNMW